MKILDEIYKHDPYIEKSLLPHLANIRVGITGANGFLGRNWIYFFHLLNREFSANISIDAFDLSSAMDKNHLFGSNYYQVDVSKKFDLPRDLDFMIHAASIASPTKYRKHPIETIHANVAGTENILELARKGSISKVALLSTSEIYGDPDSFNIPTPESYNGNVSCSGPRACYDESKRLAETLNWIYANEFNVNTVAIRPFNVFGPGQNINDGRIVPDVLTAILNKQNFILRSNGLPTRTYCFVSDFIIGSVASMVFGVAGEGYNVGNDKPEISIFDLLSLFNSILIKLSRPPLIIEEMISSDKHYLTDNPQRRCPNIQKMSDLCDWNPKVKIDVGIEKLLKHYLENFQV
jgi:UDP-glucuronate decarboxylase